jgi:hypothetical protein
MHVCYRRIIKLFIHSMSCINFIHCLFPPPIVLTNIKLIMIWYDDLWLIRRISLMYSCGVLHMLCNAKISLFGCPIEPLLFFLLLFKCSLASWGWPFTHPWSINLIFCQTCPMFLSVDCMLKVKFSKIWICGS